MKIAFFTQAKQPIHRVFSVLFLLRLRGTFRKIAARPSRVSSPNEQTRHRSFSPSPTVGCRSGSLFCTKRSQKHERQIFLHPHFFRKQKSRPYYLQKNSNPTVHKSYNLASRYCASPGYTLALRATSQPRFCTICESKLAPFHSASEKIYSNRRKKRCYFCQMISEKLDKNIFLINIFFNRKRTQPVVRKISPIHENKMNKNSK